MLREKTRDGSDVEDREEGGENEIKEGGPESVECVEDENGDGGMNGKGESGGVAGKKTGESGGCAGGLRGKTRRGGRRSGRGRLSNSGRDLRKSTTSRGFSHKSSTPNVVGLAGQSKR